MIKSVRNISAVKREISDCLDSDVCVRVNLGRNKFATYRGKVTGVYPALFTVTPIGDYSGKTSFSYSEVMCGLVQLKKTGVGI